MRQSFEEKDSTLDPKRDASGDQKPQKDQSGTQPKDEPATDKQGN